MKDSDKNRDPARAQKRAATDAKCALRKLGLLADLETLAGRSFDELKAGPIVTATYLQRLAAALNLGGAS